VKLFIQVDRRRLIVRPIFEPSEAGEHFDIPPQIVRYRREFQGIPYVDLVKAVRAAGPGNIVEIQEKKLPSAV